MTRVQAHNTELTFQVRELETQLTAARAKVAFATSLATIGEVS